MIPTSKVLWGEGLFLRPQHFQQQDAYHEWRLAETARALHPFAWGLRRLHVDTDALATGTKYDAILKLSDNTDGYAVAVLLNDPTSSFFEYLNANSGYDWKEITGSLSAAAKSFTPDVDLI